MTAARDPFDTLREELERVSVSDGFAGRVRERIAADQAVDLAPIEAELSAVSVSPEFAARVRARAAATDTRRGRWQWIGGLAAAAAVVLATWVGLNRGEVNPAEAPAAPAIAQTIDRPEPLAPGMPEPATANPAPELTEPRTPAPAEPRTHEPRNPGTPEPAFEVITTQPQILAGLWASATRVEATQVVAPIAPIETVAAPLEMDLATIEIAPVVVKWLVEPPPAMGFPLPIILRIAAAEAARRPE